MEKKGKIPKEIAQAAGKLHKTIQTSPTVQETLGMQRRKRVDMGISSNGSECVVPYTEDRARDDTLRFQFERSSGTLYYIDQKPGNTGKNRRIRIPHSFYDNSH
ncbi:MAG TPA: hypothetical protein VG935_00115 [Patescibacteria group bacterium]|nr:hypothetical protein [Patescibacteria group bacterium]